MGIFNKLQDVYYSTLELAREIKQIPPECDCGDAEAHLNGHCCCAAENRIGRAFAQSSNQGCLARLSHLSKELRSLDDDFREGAGRIEPSEDSRQLQGQLSMIISLAYQLTREIEHIRADLDDFRKQCASDALQRIKQRAASLDRYAAQLNTLL